MLLGALDIRVVGKNDGVNSEGRLEVFSDGNWNTICNDNWTHKSTLVACTTLGYFNGGTLSEVSSGSEDNSIRSITCSGDEERLADCHAGHPSTSCSHDDDVGIVCWGPSK